MSSVVLAVKWLHIFTIIVGLYLLICVLFLFLSMFIRLFPLMIILFISPFICSQYHSERKKSKPKPKSKPIFSKKEKKEIITLVKESKKKKEYHNKNFVSVSSINTKEYKIKKEKSRQFTKSILSKPTNGDPNDRNVLFHVLAAHSKAQGKECVFTQDKNNKNSKHIGTMGSSNQSCVLALDNLDDVLPTIITNDRKKTKNKRKTKRIRNTESHEKQDILKKQILDIRKDIKQKKKNRVVENLKKKLGKVHGVDPKYVIIKDIYYGSAHIDYEIVTNFTKRGNVTQAMKDQFSSYKDLKLHPLFFEESFNVNDFDERGHKNFGNGSEFDVGPSGRTQKYRQPSGWTRYGLKVLDGRYGTNHKWLHPFQDPGNWYRAYHGTGANIGKLIVNGPSNNQNRAFFKTGGRQACQNHQAHCGGPVGKGVYCSPNPQIAEGYCKNHVTIQTTEGPKTFKFMFQVCVDPNVVRMSVSSKDIWVVPDGKTEDAMRPYGILLKQI